MKIEISQEGTDQKEDIDFTLNKGDFILKINGLKKIKKYSFYVKEDGTLSMSSALMEIENPVVKFYPIVLNKAEYERFNNTHATVYEKEIR